MLDKFAEELRKARGKKGITLQQLAAKTRIDFKFLEAIDNGNFSFLPELYVKAFIKQYAKVVGLDEKETIERYEDAKEGRLADRDESKSLLEKKLDIERKKEKEPAPRTVKSFTDISTQRSPDNQGKKSNTNLIAAAVIAALAIILIIYFLVFNKSSDIIIEEKPYEQVLNQSKERFKVEKTENASGLAASQLSDSLLLEISNEDSSDSLWVLVITDDKIKEDFLLYPGRSKIMRALGNFKFTLGNSGVVSLKLNDNPLSFEGRRGSVRHFLVDSTGIKRLYSPPILKIE
jgi:cytoskeletal protein RodZ